MLERAPGLIEPAFRAAWIVLGLSIIASVLAWRIVVASLDANAQAEFDDLLSGFAGELERTITAYEQALVGTAAFVTTHPTVTRSDFRTYLHELDVINRFPGLQGVGYAAIFPASELEAVEKAIRADGFKDFAVRPAGPREIYSAIIFLEPLDWRNERAFGYDMYSESVRREAMQRARDSGMPVASGAVFLVQETDTDVQAGFLLYVPIYRSGAATNSVTERRKAIKGFVYSPIRVKNLINAVLARERLPVRRNAQLRISAPGVQNEQVVIFDSEEFAQTSGHTPKFVAGETVNLHGVDWRIELSSTPGFERKVDYTPAWSVLGAGAIFSALLAGLVASAATRHRQTSLANKRMELLTRELAHRVKNTLAVVQSIASRSLTDGRPLEEARHVFSQRLHALARAHTHLTESSWRGVSIKELVRDELQPFGARATITGPDVAINANAAQTFALVVHELATNAVKHGALSTPKGQVDVRWIIIRNGGQHTLSFHWKEKGGPVVQQPKANGFGQTLLRQAIVHGAVRAPETFFDSDGLRYEFEVPLGPILADESDEV